MKSCKRLDDRERACFLNLKINYGYYSYRLDNIINETDPTFFLQLFLYFLILFDKRNIINLNV